jgi:hypothetical protein
MIKARGLLYTILGLLIGTLLFTIISNSEKDFSPEEVGLGKNTSGVNSVYEGDLIFATDDASFLKVKKSILKAKGEGYKIALVLGASQTYSVNNKKEDDNIFVFYANQMSDKKNLKIKFFLFSRPNGNLHDILSSYLRFRQNETKPDWLIIPMVYDDLREKGIQAVVLNPVKKIAFESTILAEQGVQNILEKLQVTSKKENYNKNSSVNVLAHSPQEKLENYLVGKLSSSWEAFTYRQNIISNIKLMTSALTIKVFGKLFQRRVPEVPENMKKWNMQAFESIISISKADNVKLFVYKQPHPQGIVPFYHTREKYDLFFSKLKLKSEKQNFFFFDYEALVPLKYWGETNEGRQDVFHFQVEGHKILSENIMSTFMKILGSEYAL